MIFFILWWVNSGIQCRIKWSNVLWCVLIQEPVQTNWHNIVKVTLKSFTPFVDSTVKGCEKVSDETILLHLAFLYYVINEIRIFTSWYFTSFEIYSIIIQPCLSIHLNWNAKVACFVWFKVIWGTQSVLQQ